MHRILTILTIFTIVIAPDAYGGYIVHKAEDKVEEKIADDEKVEKKFEQEAIKQAIEHCLRVSDKITQHFDLINAYNRHFTNDDLVNERDFAAKQQILNYLWGRPDIPDFRLILPKYQNVMTREQYIKLNSIILLLLAEKFEFMPNQHPFHGNCQVKKTKNSTDKDFANLVVTMPLAIGTKQITLRYLMKAQENYGWYINDIVFEDFSLAINYRRELSLIVQSKGVEDMLEFLCSQSEYPSLKCQSIIEH
ncbi:MAG: hypothetical protein COV36_08115 [Alphaproteobacteria bacterium CG11_big_fil_rev_8_21_14_0_20_44_7]|nr:MAG: hypothetical protein COV36_08115 [Alphaproteobacteria bacterium CG11_big_fil_rev_8_21_14_0_20_44_7]